MRGTRASGFCAARPILVRMAAHRDGSSAGRGAQDADWIDVRLAGDARPAGMQALTADPALTVIVRPDRVIAAIERCRLPRLPWRPATAVPGWARLPRPLIRSRRSAPPAR